MTLFCNYSVSITLSPPTSHLSATNRDRTEDPARSKVVSATDELSRKVAGNDLRGMNFMQHSIDTLYTRFQLFEDWFYINNMETQMDEPFPILKPCTPLATCVDYGGFRIRVECATHVDEPSTLLHGHSTAYTGPPRSAEEEEEEEEESGTQDEQNITHSDIVKKDQQQGVFVAALPDYDSLLQQLSDQMYIQLQAREAWVALTSLNEAAADETFELERGSVSLLSEALQAHKGVESDRIYLLNFQHLLPPDLPRVDSFDLLTNTVRPEFLNHLKCLASMKGAGRELVKGSRAARAPRGSPTTTAGAGGAGGAGVAKLLSADCFVASAWIDSDMTVEKTREMNRKEQAQASKWNLSRDRRRRVGEGEEGSDEDEDEDKESTLSMEQDTPSLFDAMGISYSRDSWLNSRGSPNKNKAGQMSATVTAAVYTLANQLYKIAIPNLAKYLDAQLLAMPLDSQGVANILHTHGLNLRHLGLLYPLCKTVYVRQTLLCEIVARSLKLVLRDTQRKAARQAKGQAIVAEVKGRSFAKDFVELMEHTNRKRADIVIELFNLTFDATSQSNEFWSGMLSQVIARKFGVVVGSKEAAMGVLHLPQLFVAMQYHLGTRVLNSVYGNLSTKGLLESMCFEDLVNAGDVAEPKISSALHIPGKLGR